MPRKKSFLNLKQKTNPAKPIIQVVPPNALPIIVLKLITGETLAAQIVGEFSHVWVISDPHVVVQDWRLPGAPIILLPWISGAAKIVNRSIMDLPKTQVVVAGPADPNLVLSYYYKKEQEEGMPNSNTVYDWPTDSSNSNPTYH